MFKTKCISFSHTGKRDWCSSKHFRNTPLSCSLYLLRHWCTTECFVYAYLLFELTSSCNFWKIPLGNRGCVTFWGMIHDIIRGVCLTHNIKWSELHILINNRREGWIEGNRSTVSCWTDCHLLLASADFNNSNNCCHNSQEHWGTRWNQWPCSWPHRG